MQILAYLGIAIVYFQAALVPGIDSVAKNGYVAEANKYLAMALKEIPQPQIAGGVVPSPEPAPQPESSEPMATPSCSVSLTTRPLNDSEIKLNQDMGLLVPPNSVVTRVDWNLSGLPKSTAGKLYEKDSNGSWVDLGINLKNEDVGPYPGQNSARFSKSFPLGIKADFNGTVCSANPQ